MQPSREELKEQLRNDPAALAAFREQLRGDTETWETIAQREGERRQAARQAVPAECPICGTIVDSFMPFGKRVELPDRQCPTCDSLERHRLIWLYFHQRTNLFDEPLAMLHIAPEPCFVDRLRASVQHYVTADLSSGNTMVHFDLTQSPFPDESFDVIYASHVLEHIPDDIAAMSEVRRMLRVDGWAILMVPMWGPTTEEDPDAPSDERHRRFGQADHVRIYGHDGEFARRLDAAGFDVTVDRFAAALGDDADRYRLTLSEDVYFLRKRG